ncbi:hypothetical protein CXB49_11980 [Chromobacterium sp. ATCC 53434]|uniref:hypothetical protein n=1 Tax=Chromobacterium TaxID=535 RepID=UPI000C771611|nr:hypothetical protein [Chromobacterium sp. ATCC 53434]AUH51486.1 hypothetical protein CXB49_11980 [Chromobacterium sp. ATCC 53434]
MSKQDNRAAGLLRAAFERLPYEALLAGLGILIFLAGVTVGSGTGAGSAASSCAAPAAAGDAAVMYQGKDERGRPHYVVNKDSLW